MRIPKRSDNISLDPLPPSLFGIRVPSPNVPRDRAQPCEFPCGQRQFDPLLSVAFALFLLCATAPTAESEPRLVAENGMVVSASPFASETGVAIMKRGGNAIDAAAATGFALAVTFPSAGNLGGGGFLVACMESGEAFTLDFRERAPLAARRDMFLDIQGEVIPDISLKTIFGVGVPGSVDGLLRVWRDRGSGKISRRALLAPAIRLAEDGFEITNAMAVELNRLQAFFGKDPGAAAVFIRRDGRDWREGDRLIQEDLAETLMRIAEEGRDGFYRGAVADRIVRQMRQSKGIIGYEDLARYESTYRWPVTGTFENHTVVSMGPPSSGGVLLVQMLNMLEHFPLERLGWNRAPYIHVLTEVERRAYADRSQHLGDPDHWDVPVEKLISKAYARERYADISMDRATPSEDVRPGSSSSYESIETTHYSVVDGSGNAVSVTTTLNTGFGCGIVVQGAGFLLNNEMDDFSAKPGVPNFYGLVGSEANAIEPGKRMLSSMTPTIVLKNREPFLVLGSPGGSTIITTVLQIVLNVLVHGSGRGAARAFPVAAG